MRPFGPNLFEPANEWKNVRARAFSRATRGSVRARSRPSARVSDLSARRYALTTGLGSGHARAERHVLKELHGGLVSYLLSDSECVRFRASWDASVIPVRLARHLPGLSRADGVDREAGASRTRRHRTSHADDGESKARRASAFLKRDGSSRGFCERCFIWVARQARPQNPPHVHRRAFSLDVMHSQHIQSELHVLFCCKTFCGRPRKSMKRKRKQGSRAPSSSKGRARYACRIRGPRRRPRGRRWRR